MAALPKSLLALQARHPEIIDEIWDERCDDNGYWLYLKPGYWNVMTETHCIHELTVKECLAYFKYVEPCDCDQCKANR